VELSGINVAPSTTAITVQRVAGAPVLGMVDSSDMSGIRIEMDSRWDKYQGLRRPRIRPSGIPRNGINRLWTQTRRSALTFSTSDRHRYVFRANSGDPLASTGPFPYVLLPDPLGQKCDLVEGLVRVLYAQQLFVFRSRICHRELWWDKY
jgi:hypothetical protein